MEVTAGLERTAIAREADAGEVAIGIGTTPATVDDLALESEIPNVGRVVSTTVLRTGNVVLVTAITAAMESTREVTEIALFDQSDSAKMLSHNVFAPITSPATFPVMTEQQYTFSNKAAV